MESKVYKEFKEIEKKHWWFVARREILRLILSDFFTKKSHKTLDIGPGPGINLPMLKDFSDNIVCIEPSQESADEIKNEFKDIEVLHGTFPDVLPSGNFDLITMFDVIEHIEDETAVLQSLKKYLTPGGLCIVTVPAYMFLWSEHDDLVHHKRRYTQKVLRNAVEKAGFSIVRMSCFNTLLFIPIAFVRIFKNAFGNNRQKSDFSITPGWANTILKSIFLFEKYLLKYLNLPFGVSIVCVFRQNSL